MDLLVVGAGPAGTACAIHAAGAGLRVALLAPAQGRARPGETLHPGVEPVFDRLGIGDAVRAAGWLRHPGHRIGPERRLLRYGGPVDAPWRGFQAPTAALDVLLRERACAAGVRWIDGSADGLIVRAEGARLRIDGARMGATGLRAALTVDATGPVRLARRALGLEAQAAGPKRRVYWGYADRAPDDLAGEPHFMEFVSGWLWRAPLHDGRCAWVWGPRHDAGSSIRHLDAQVAALLEAGATGRCRGASATSTLVTQPAHFRGLLIAGDAAFSVSPLAGKGVLRALLMGMAAGDMAQRMLTGQALPARPEAAYAAWVAHWFAREAAAAAVLHGDAPHSEDVKAAAGFR